MKTKVAWVNRVTRYGSLYNVKPVRCATRKDVKGYWSKGEDLDARNLGESGDMWGVTYASKSQKEAQAWTDGVMAAMSIIKSWASGENGENA